METAPIERMRNARSLETQVQNATLKNARGGKLRTKLGVLPVKLARQWTVACLYDIVRCVGTRINPFRPGSIVNTGMFAGRYQELRILEQTLVQTRSGNPHHFLLHGERGIGKSSLLFYFDCIATGRFKSLSGESFKFLTVTLELEKNDQYADLIRKVGNEFTRVLRKEHKAKEIAKTVWDFVKRWEVLGVKYAAKDAGGYELIEQLTDFVADAMLELETRFDGVLISIDEADKSAVNTRLGELVKLFTERLTKRDCNKIALILAGLTPLIRGSAPVSRVVATNFRNADNLRSRSLSRSAPR